MKNIIVPIDFSEHSEYALMAAAALARKHKSEIIALNMLDLSDIIHTTAGGDPEQKNIFYNTLAAQEMELFLKKDYLQYLEVIPILKPFKVIGEINDIAVKYGADLIVMGSHGVNGVKKLVMGSNTERVVRHSNIPVLVVKNEVANVDFKNIVFACDFSKEMVKPYMHFSKRFQKKKISLVYVNLPNDKFLSTVEFEKRVQEFLLEADGHLARLEDVHFISDYTAEEGIINFSNKIGADIIAIPTHGRKGIAHFLEGSIGEDLANHATLPVITFKI